MNMRTRIRELTAVAVVAVVGLALTTVPALAQQAGEEGQAVAQGQDQSRQIKVKILGMSCPFCAYGVEQKLKKLEGVMELEVELKSGIATLTMKEGADVSNETLKQTVDDAGFEAAAIVRSFESEHEDWNPGRLRADPAPEPRAPEDTGQPAGGGAAP